MVQNWRRTRVVSRAGWLMQWRFKRIAGRVAGEIVQLHALRDIYVTRTSLIVANGDERRTPVFITAIKIPYFRDTASCSRGHANIFRRAKRGTVRVADLPGAKWIYNGHSNGRTGQTRGSDSIFRVSLQIYRALVRIRASIHRETLGKSRGRLCFRRAHRFSINIPV